MDIVGGLAAANQAIGLVKELRDIDRSVDEAAFKSKIAEVTLALADAKLALSDARVEVSRLSELLSTKQKELDVYKNGDHCPKCLSGRMKLLETKGHTLGGLDRYGVQDWTYACDDAACGFQQKKIVDPHGALITALKKR